LLVHAEQGLGDTIQLFRFLTTLRRDARVVLCAPPGLVRLFAAQPDAPLVIAYRDIIPPTDLYCMMGSLPWLLGAELHNIPAAPYLRADPVRAVAWEARLPRRTRIGIMWAGNCPGCLAWSSTRFPNRRICARIRHVSWHGRRNWPCFLRGPE
jgi:hypothetical protein